MLVDRPTRRAGRAGLSALTIEVAPVSVHMLQHPDMVGDPYRIRVLRLELPMVPLALSGQSAVARIARTTTRNTLSLQQGDAG